jgi:hypothetical protein
VDNRPCIQHRGAGAATSPSAGFFLQALLRTFRGLVLEVGAAWLVSYLEVEGDLTQLKYASFSQSDTCRPIPYLPTLIFCADCIFNQKLFFAVLMIYSC